VEWCGVECEWEWSESGSGVGVESSGSVRWSGAGCAAGRRRGGCVESMYVTVRNQNAREKMQQHESTRGICGI
jgi:hypothetical protein